MNTTRRGFLSSVAAIAPLSVCGLLPRRKRIKWDKGEWRYGRRPWTAVVRTDRATAIALGRHQCCNNSKPYYGVRAKHLWFAGCVFTDSEASSSLGCITLMEFGVVRSMFYDAVSFTDLFRNIKDAYS